MYRLSGPNQVNQPNLKKRSPTQREYVMGLVVTEKEEE